jgi:glutamate N-acetyltransferase / amino-acid N-acetyltransferase
LSGLASGDPGLADEGPLCDSPDLLFDLQDDRFMSKTKTPVSPLAPARFPTMPRIAGVRFCALAAGLKYKGRKDLFVAELAKGTSVAGVFTRSKTASAPVSWCRDALKDGRGRAVVVNAGNANAFTGAAGMETVEVTAQAAAKALGCRKKDVFIGSTGVIGETFDGHRIGNLVARMAKNLKPGGWKAAAEAITTTDTFTKAATATAMIGGKAVTIGGIAKGSGMIAPDMATMLAFVFTDAKIPAGVLQKLLVASNGKSFNSITVDSDTSTSDTCLLFATGQARHSKIASVSDPALKDFKAALDQVMQDLAHQIVRDGEGATKFVTVNVQGAENKQAARCIALSVANSPLVKTALAGEDANWGRVVMAVGKAGEKADRDKMRIQFGPHVIADNGQAVPDYDEAPVAAYMKGDNIDITTHVGVGRGTATVWTCDLTHGYISINADYRS